MGQRRMRRVVVTGLGVLSSIGSSTDEVRNSLYKSNSGLMYMPQMEQTGLRCSVYAPIREWNRGMLGKRAKQTMSTVSQYALVAVSEAIKDAGLGQDHLSSPLTGVCVGTAFGGINEVFPAEDLVRMKKPSRAGMTGIVKIMNSTVSGNLAAHLGIRGRTCSISSSFASGLDNIGHGYELIQHGLQDICICGAAEEDCWRQLGAYFDNWGGMPRNWNKRPTEACRPYDRDREGFVMSAGAGILILEALEHARKRGKHARYEIVGYGASNDGDDMFRPSGLGLGRAIHQAMHSASEQGVNKVDYINTHGTGTPLGDEVEIRTIREAFEPLPPAVSSTKGLTGHGMAASGAQEAVYALLMLCDNFIAPTTNLSNIAEECSGVPHVPELVEKKLTTVMSISVGLGGATGCVIFNKM